LLADDTPAGLLARSRYHNAVTLQVDDPERAASRLGRLDEAREIELRNARITDFPSGQGNLFQAVSRVIDEEGWAIQQLQYEPRRLDAVFRSITREEAA